ncbi:toxin ParE1/3/4 [Nitrosospira multiformis ATCC 25196]|uniref:Toxin n=1 Tax=Nitrosospira multiformis (strain ATCC 25196 / NCIMB 11849 / C 71) TaxID=323848 RepID=Q2Y599_NITMU|nr:type II toxin-antitoxin system RelE/ParE family toxin [Nitrosospira multiformis]ABB76072.1 Plasmid stabilization system [Nitrosospira multiformis ATCC 25196]SEG15361.1 toxin ParE1/3/4 [Nitrosospira multiformis ATCC 25196]
MKRYILSPAAKTDITNIRKYTIQKWGKSQADKYTLELRERMRWLADNPMLGRARDEVKEGYRSFKEGSHIIFYRVVESTIEIIGIPHQNMDIEQNLEEEILLFTNIADGGFEGD